MRQMGAPSLVLVTCTGMDANSVSYLKNDSINLTAFGFFHLSVFPDGAGTPGAWAPSDMADQVSLQGAITKHKTLEAEMLRLGVVI
jgi:hypothetical protein